VAWWSATSPGIEQTRQVAEQANASGRFDAVIHNAGVYLEPQRVETSTGSLTCSPSTCSPPTCSPH